MSSKVEIIGAALCEFGAEMKADIQQEGNAALIARDRQIANLEGQLKDASALLADALNAHKRDYGA